MKLLVMGAGYVGMALLNQMHKKPYEIVVTTTQKDRIQALKKLGHEVFCLESNTESEFQEMLRSCQGMVILVAPKDPNTYIDTYLHTAKRIASALVGITSPFYLLYTSSTSVYEGHSGWVSEPMDLHPESTNAKILLETERIYLNCGVNACILRLGGIYGPQRELIDRAIRFSGQVLPGTGNEPTNHVHLDDIVTAILLCIDHAFTGLYNLVNDDHTTRKELYSSLCQSLSIPSPIWNLELLQSRQGGYKVSNQKIKNSGFIFKYPLLKL